MISKPQTLVEASPDLPPGFPPIVIQKGGYPGEEEIVREIGGTSFIQSGYSATVRMPLHSHPFPVLHIVLGGNVTNRSRRSAEAFAVAQVEYLPANVPHETQWQRGGAGFAVAFEGRKAEEWQAWGMLPDSPITLPPGLVSALLLAVRQEALSPDLAAVTGAESLVAETLGEIARRTQPDHRKEGPSRRLRQARAILLDTYNSLPTLADIARQVDVHPVYLARAFRRAFGETVGDCLRRRRLEVACQLMAGSSFRLSEIAREAGFADQSHLTRTFKQYLRMTPVDYQRTVQGTGSKKRSDRI
ncbi:MAG: AraC family transcriptional regulator [Capsulimonadales bacterium]|nr:AraC family transcriptional regulator [Capsulimonadales bacterium]